MTTILFASGDPVGADGIPADWLDAVANREWLPYLVAAPPAGEDDTGGSPPAGDPGCHAPDVTLDPTPAEASPAANLATRLGALAEILEQVAPDLVVIRQPRCSDSLATATALAASRNGIPVLLVPVPGTDPVGGYSTDGMTLAGVADLTIEGQAGGEAFLTAVDQALSPDGPALPGDRDARGRTFGTPEATAVLGALRRGTLNSTAGVEVSRFEREFATATGRKHGIACTSGSGAVHCAVAALGLSAGDEVITTPITDMGALTPILYEGAVPVFADVDPGTLNVTAGSISAQWTPRTRAVIVTHLFGLPADTAPIRALCRDRGVPLIEDAAQAFLAGTAEGAVGSFGSLSCYSLQQGKHMTTGEGGIVTCDDPDIAQRVRLAVNKAWPYGQPDPDHRIPALNQRMTELQGAVARQQLARLPAVVARRREIACQLFGCLQGLPGIRLPGAPDGWLHSYWKFPLMVDETIHPGGPDALAARLRDVGIPAAPRYIQKPAFACGVFRTALEHPVSALPLGQSARPAADAEASQGPAGRFGAGDYPGAFRGLAQVLVLPVNERWLPAQVDWLGEQIRNAVTATPEASQ